MKKIFVIGGTGMVASKIIGLWKDKFEVVSSDEKILDITNENAVKDYFENNHYDVVVNFAAFTNVDAAEAQKGDESGLVWKLNVLGPKYLAEVCRQKSVFFVHISTDFVFPGNEAFPGPYSEETKIPQTQDGIGWYGWSKNRGEKEVAGSGAKHAIIRYGYPFRADNYETKLDWARNLLKLYNEQKLYPLFTDQIQSIVLIDDLATPLGKIIENETEGVYHLASCDTTTPFEAGSYLLEKFSGKPVEIQKGSMIDFLKSPGRTPRPRLGGLKVGATEEKLGIKFRTWKEMIDEFLNQLNS